MSKRVPSVLVILLTLTLFFPLSCSDKEQVTEEIIRPVRYTQVFSTGSDRMRSFSGSVRSEEESKLSFKVSGTIINLPVKLGDVVKKGQLIAQLDPKDYQLRVQESEASLTQVRAEARNAAANYERVRQLYENQNASLSDLDIARTQAESTQAQVRSIEKQLELTRFQLSYTKLSAPVDGSIASVDIEINENVNAGDTVALLTACCKLEVEVAIPESLISGIRDGDSVTVKLDALPGNRIIWQRKALYRSTDSCFGGPGREVRIHRRTG
jgi:RND family efflux transporter MFP subunit